MSEPCTGCEHTRALHFRDVDGVVRCLWRDSGLSSSGIIGLPYSVECDCIDFVSKTGDYRRERRAEEQQEHDEMIDRIVGAAKDRFDIGDIK